MHIILIAVGFLFFANPMRGVIDVFPDFIGCLLILAGLNRCAAVVEKLEEAKESFLRLTLVTLLRMASFFLSLSISDASRLMLVTVFSILELIFLIPATTKLIDGFVYAAMRCGGEAAMAYQNKSGASKGEMRRVETVDGFKRFSVFFLSIRALLNILPELVALQDVNDMPLEALPLADFYELFFWGTAIICLIFGVVWAVREFRYFGGIARDEVIVGALRRKYETEVLPNVARQTVRDYRLLRRLLILLSVFSIHFYLDYEDFIPGFLFAVLFIILTVLLGAPKRYIAVGAAHGCVSVALLICRAAFLRETDIADVAHWSEAARDYIPVCVLTVCTAALGVCSVILLAKSLWHRVLGDIPLIGIDPRKPDIPAADAEVIAHLKKRLCAAAVGVSLPFVSDVIFVFAAPYFPWLSVLHLVAAVVAVVSSVSLTTALDDYPYRRIADMA